MKGIYSLIVWFIICGGCMVAMIFFATGKSVVIEEASLGNESQRFKNDTSVDESEQSLVFRQVEATEKVLSIPLEMGMNAGDIKIENRYMEKELWIHISNIEESFFLENEISGNISIVEYGVYQFSRGDTILKIQMKEIFEYRTVLENDVLYIECYLPHEVYDFVVVIDPRGGGIESGIVAGNSNEKDISLSIAQSINNSFVVEKTKIYYTRIEDVEVSTEQRKGLVEDVKADIYIGIGVNQNLETEEYFGTEVWYNGEYFIPKLGNLQLADAVERAVVTSVSGRALGVIAMDQDELLDKLTIPAVLLKTGYVTNEVEATLLNEIKYVDKIAAGIVEALRTLNIVGSSGAASK